jgi:hypothetical protein
VQVFSDEDAWDVLADIPNDSAAALLLIEHHWAVPLRDAVARAGGFRLSDGFISPLDLVELGLLEAEEATDLHAMETTAVAASQRHPPPHDDLDVPAMIGSRRVARRTARRVDRRN